MFSPHKQMQSCLVSGQKPLTLITLINYFLFLNLEKGHYCSSFRNTCIGSQQANPLLPPGETENKLTAAVSVAHKMLETKAAPCTLSYKESTGTRQELSCKQGDRNMNLQQARPDAEQQKLPLTWLPRLRHSVFNQQGQLSSSISGCRNRNVINHGTISALPTSPGSCLCLPATRTSGGMLSAHN